MEAEMPESAQTTCPVCGGAAEGGHHMGDTTVFMCPRCGGYRIARTALTLLELGTLQRPDPKWFADLVERKRGDSTAYPVIT